MTVKTIFPVTRIHEPLRVDVDVQGGRVVDAWVSGYLFRGFEIMLNGRDPRDVALFTQRICGICSSAHAVAAAMAQQRAFGVMPTPNGQLLTNLIFAADILQNHLRHFYVLVLYDYVRGPDMPPYTPRISGDYRLPARRNQDLLDHARTGVDMAARAHEMMAVFGSKAPHQQTIMASGVTERATAEHLAAYRSILQELTAWISQVHLADVMTLAEYYPDYYNIGGGYGHFLSYGLFPQLQTGKRAWDAGVVVNKGQTVPLDTAQITEDVKFAWYQDDQARQPAAGITAPDRGKAEAYTWVKAPRYQGLPLESGPLARGWVNGHYRRGVSVMDRLVARAQEALQICRLAADWLQQVVPGAPTLKPYTLPADGEGEGLTDAMRGALGHWLRVQNGRVSHYQIVTPTVWNFSPRDSQGLRGPVEQALIGTSVADPDNLIEVGRVLRSFDPCFTCAAHVLAAPPDKVTIV